MAITVNDVETAYPIFTGLTWTTSDTNYFYDIAYERVESDLPYASEKTQILGMCYYIASLHKGAAGSSIQVTSESLGDHSYTVKDSTTIDLWSDRYNSLVSENSVTDIWSDALYGVDTPDVPPELWLDRW